LLTRRKQIGALLVGVAIVAIATPFAFSQTETREAATSQPTAAATRSPLATIQPTLPPLPADLNVHVNPVDDLRPDSIMGADVSMLAQMEANGARFYEGGQQKDCLQILRDHGINWIRLRTWVDPTDDNQVALGGGNDDLATTVALASRAKQMGFGFLLDFHYSDWWADPGKQNMPKAWTGLNSTQLQAAVYEYTSRTIRTLAAAGAMPDMVQIGNEINGGMMWPAGQTFPKSGVEIGGYDGLAALLTSGIKAVHDADPYGANPAKRARIVIHLANGGDNDLYRTVFDNLTSRGVDFDVIGLSYYNYWHGPLKDLVTNLNDISQRYGKDVAVVETAYAYGLSNAEATPDLFTGTTQDDGDYVASVAGQATAVRDVIAAVAQVPNKRGLGVFYWEPDWYAVPGAGWKTGEGNEWDNQAMFEPTGEALPSMYVFRLVRPDSGSSHQDATVIDVEPIAMEIPAGTLPKLPPQARATYSDGSIRPAPIEWQMPDASAFAAGGKVTVTGTISGSTNVATAVVSVTSLLNYVQNPGFETGSLAPWMVTGDTGAVDASDEAGNQHAGTFALHYWSDKPFVATASQTIDKLDPGTWALSAWFQGGGGENSLELFATCDGKSLTATAANTGWQEWAQISIEHVVVTGSCTVGVKVDAPAGTWGFVDDFKLIKSK
jgi:arabinogalactan endo-1,4-beta-galactosidase